MRRLAVLLMTAGLALPAAARAAGGPAPAIQGGAGVGAPGQPGRYVAVTASASTTVLERVVNGQVDWWQTLHGSLGVPAAAGDGTATGLSADGRTLVLSELSRRYPPRRTRLVVLDVRRYNARVRDRVSLPGFFTVDAISPDGRRLYLIHYTHGNDLLRYEVRAYDLPRHRLLAKPIVDPREPDEKMLGTPVTRVMSRDGRWAYTLYARPQDAPFIHALDTRAGTAACIDLDGVAASDATTLRLTPPAGGRPLVVATASGHPVKLVDPRTFAVSDPGPPATPRKPAARHAASGDDGGGLPWGVGVALLAGLAALGLTARRLARPKSAA
jgi:hypothetical protein